ncbi:MAG: hypothetical protein IT454_22810 [Planctomycetes bacterium]|nr:hypothetical protein [Planctomycetota bacterium]
MTHRASNASQVVRASRIAILIAALAAGTAARPQQSPECSLPAQPESPPISWPAGVVYYEFDANVSAFHRAEVETAMNQWRSCGAMVRFVPRPNGATNYVRIVSGASNSSYVGMIGGAQQLTLANWESRYIIVHELCHALGFWHEQSRWDRDGFVSILWANIQANLSHNFNAYQATEWLTTATPYDFDSVMHYHRCAFSVCCPAGTYCNCAIGCETISSAAAIGQLAYLSAGDILDMENAYGAVDSTIDSWGINNIWGLLNDPTPAAFVEVDAGWRHSAVRTRDGQVLVWGDNSDGVCNVPALPPGIRYVQVSAGRSYCLALRSDGSALGWGWNLHGQCSVPSLPSGITYVEVAAGQRHGVARRSDGSVVAWGNNSAGQCNVPALSGGLTYVEIAAGWAFSVARRSDGSVVAWGANDYNQCIVPAPPAGVGYVDIAAGDAHVVALRSDGNIVAWGRSGSGQCNVPVLPAGVTYVSADADGYHSLGLRSDGVLKAWGSNADGQCNVPPPPPGYRYVEVDAGYDHTISRLQPVWGEILSYCTAGTSSTGCTPWMSSAGAPSATATSGFLVTCNAVEGQRIGYFYYGLSGRSAAPWGTSSSLT